MRILTLKLEIPTRDFLNAKHTRHICSARFKEGNASFIFIHVSWPISSQCTSERQLWRDCPDTIHTTRFKHDIEWLCLNMLIPIHSSVSFSLFYKNRCTALSPVWYWYFRVMSVCIWYSYEIYNIQCTGLANIYVWWISTIHTRRQYTCVVIYKEHDS